MPTSTQPASPAMRELLRDLRDDLELTPSGSGHFQIVHKETGEPLRAENGRPITVPGTPRTSGKSFENTRQNLIKAGALDLNGDTPARQRERDEQLALERSRAEAEGEERVRLTNELRHRLEPMLVKVGGINHVRPTDMARIAARVHGDWALDSALTTTSNFLAGKSLGPKEVERLTPLVERLEKSRDPRAEWFGMLREVLGLEGGVFPGREWPYSVKLVNLDKLFADDRYQRPVQEAFVRDLVLRFDERLVGTLNVSMRDDGSYAILDGLQRKTAMERAGKTAALCAIHQDLTVEQEATVFFHLNRDRRAVHPYYDFKARLTAGDPVVAAIEEIVTKAGFELSITAQGAAPGVRERNIASIRTVEEVYGYGSDVRSECLTPTLSVIRRNWLGRPAATEASIIRGLGRFFRIFADGEIQWEPWELRLAEYGPQNILGRAIDMGGKRARGVAVSQVLVEVHNEKLPRGERLDPRLVGAIQTVPPRVR